MTAETGVSGRTIREDLGFSELEGIRDKILAEMNANPGDCGIFNRHSHVVRRLIDLRISGENLDMVMNTLADIYRIHFPHCPTFQGTRDEDKVGTNTHTNK